MGGESLDGAGERESIGLVEISRAVDSGHASIGGRNHGVGGGLDATWVSTGVGRDGGFQRRNLSLDGADHALDDGQLTLHTRRSIHGWGGDSAEGEAEGEKSRCELHFDGEVGRWGEVMAKYDIR